MRFPESMGLGLSPARGFTALLVFAWALLAAPVRAAEDGASHTIDTLHGVLIQVMKRAEELGFAGRSEMVGPAVETAFDLDFMASKTLGSHYKKLDAADRQRWVTAFTHFVVSNYARQFDGYSGQSFETVDVKPASRETVIVDTVLLRKSDDDVKLNYRLRATPGSPATEGQEDGGDETRWKIVDVYSNGTVSELALRRSEFSALLSRSGFEGLIEKVESKAAKE